MKGRSDGNSADTTKQADASVLVTKELTYDSGFNTIYYIPAYNASDTALSVWANAVAKDSANNVIGASSMSIEVLGPKETSIGKFSFHNVGEVDHIEYTLNASVASYFCPVVKHLEVEPSLYNNNLMVSITNHGSVAAEFVEAYALIENQTEKSLALNGLILSMITVRSLQAQQSLISLISSSHLTTLIFT